jgi:uncharacterized protein
MTSVCIAGASGFLGSNLVQRLRNENFVVTTLSRDDFNNEGIYEKVGNSSIVINLVGESIAGLWTKKKKKRIYNSRILTTKKLVEAINRKGENVELLIQVSGVAIYDRYHTHTEDSNEIDGGFLSRVIIDWEGELDGIGRKELRIVKLRLGVVLDKGGGILKKITVPLKFGFGIGVRSDDYFPFVQLVDLMNIFLFCIEKRSMTGIVNVSAPQLTKINYFFRELARTKNRRIILWFRKSMIRLLMGESGSLLTEGQKVVPEKLTAEGFEFRYANIQDALHKACN